MRMVKPMISINFPLRRNIPSVHGTLVIRGTTTTKDGRRKRAVILRISLRLKGNIIHTVTVRSASNLRENLAIISANTPVGMPINLNALNHIFGILNRTVSLGKTIPSSFHHRSVREGTPAFSRLDDGFRVLRANVGIVSLLTPCLGNKGVKLFNKTNIKGAILVRRLVRGMTRRRNNVSMFANINRHAHRKGSLCRRVRRSKINGGATVMFNRVGRPPNTHVHITLSNLAVTRRFHSRRGRSILLFVSGVCQFARTNSRISTLLNQVPSTMNCRPALTARVNRLRRQVDSAGSNSVASVRTVCIPTSSCASPTPTAAFTRLSTAAGLRHGLARRKVCPTISPLTSSSDTLSPRVIKSRRCRITAGMRHVLRHCHRLRSVVTVLKVSRLSSSRGVAIGHTEQVRFFLSRGFRMTRTFAKMPKSCIPMTRAIHNFGKVIRNGCSKIPRRTFHGINAVRRILGGTGRLNCGKKR